MADRTGLRGIYPRTPEQSRENRAWVIGGALTAIWLVVAGFLFLGADSGAATGIVAAKAIVAFALPLALIWVAVGAARSAHRLQQEAASLRDELERVRHDFGAQNSNAAAQEVASLRQKIDQLTGQQKAQAEAIEALSIQLETAPSADERAAMATSSQPGGQPSLGLGTPAEDLVEPISVSQFIRAMNFPDDEQDAEGFVALRQALADPGVQKIVRASQDVLTLLSQDGIYMDDLSPDRARPELWRRFAHGERGRSVAGLGGIHDRSSLALSSGRMKTDPVFRDAVHHFLRHFDKVFMQFERHASDEEIIGLANTRTARAFMLLGRVTGTFD